MIKQRSIFLTGATGLVGGEILQSCLRQNVAQIYLLIRAPSKKEFSQRFDSLLLHQNINLLESSKFIPVRGDISLPSLGISDGIIDELSANVTDVIHCASNIDFGQTLEQARRVNLLGTINLMHLISNWRSVEHIAHISTIQVAGCRTGTIYEDELLHKCGFVNVYEQSKYEAEVYVKSLFDFLPVSIYRISGLVGNSKTGCVHQYNWLHHTMRLLACDLLPFLPVDPDLIVDLVPVDWVAETLTHILFHRFESGKTYHMAAGAPNSLSTSELSHFVYQCLVESRYARKQVIHYPEIIDQNTYNRLRKQENKDGNLRRLGMFHNLLGDFVPQWYLPKIFDRSNLHQTMSGSMYELPVIQEYLPRIIDYCLLTNWGRKEVPQKIELAKN